MFLLILERGRERERNIDVKEKHRWAASHTLDGGSNPQPKHGPQLGVKLTTFWCTG